MIDFVATKKTSDNGSDTGSAGLGGLHRSQTNRVVAGVAGGLGEYFGVDPTIFRIIFVFLFFFSGSGLLIYLILWLVMPRGDSLSSQPREHIRENIHELRSSAASFAQNVRFHAGREESKVWLGLGVIVLGFLFLLDSLGFYAGIDLTHLWPLLLIILGVLLLTKNG